MNMDSKVIPSRTTFTFLDTHLKFRSRACLKQTNKTKITKQQSLDNLFFMPSKIYESILIYQSSLAWWKLALQFICNSYYVYTSQSTNCAELCRTTPCGHRIMASWILIFLWIFLWWSWWASFIKMFTVKHKDLFVARKTLKHVPFFFSTRTCLLICQLCRPFPSKWVRRFYMSFTRTDMNNLLK